LELHRQSYNNLLRNRNNYNDLDSSEDNLDDIYSIKGNGINEEYYEVNDMQYENVFNNDEITNPRTNMIDEDQENIENKNDQENNKLFIEKKRKR
jgi:hypothetical protein